MASITRRFLMLVTAAAFILAGHNQYCQVAAQSHRLCTSRDFICTDGQCVSSEKRCDGTLDCRDRSDENCCEQNSNSGQEFILAFMNNFKGGVDIRLFLFMTSPKSLNYSIIAPNAGVDQTGFLPANTLVSVELPSSLMAPVGLGDNGILVTSSETMTVYGLNQQPHTTDAFLGLPTSVQGHEYVIGTFTTPDNIVESLILVVGIHDATTVVIELSSSAYDGIQSLSAGTNVTYAINRLQTLSVEGYDLTGSRVFTDKTVSVFGGHECANIPVNQGYCDHLVEQMPPVTTLGQHFATVPLATRTGGDLFRVVAYRDRTDIHISGVLQASGLMAGNYHEFDASSQSFLFVEASQPVLLLQFSKGSTVDGTVSDPFMLMIPPIEQYRSRYLVSTPASDPVAFTNYLGVIAPADQLPGLRLDDMPLPSSVIWSSIPGQTLMGSSVPVSIGVHTLHHVDKAKFGLSAYGFWNDDSYGYPGGLQLKAQCVVEQPKKTTDINECEDKDGRGPCQHQCRNTFGSFQCFCNGSFVLQPDRLSCGRTSQPCRCSVNGICTSGGLCECHPGWGGPRCSEPQCHLVNHCSRRGKCIAPNTCQCERGWTGFACAIDTCPQLTSCTACTDIPHCGWCDSQEKCMSGTGFGPSAADDLCPAWFFYRCVTVSSGSGNDNLVLPLFSPRIPVINCNSSCVNQAVMHRGDSLHVPGSHVWCDRRQRACQRFYRCFESATDPGCNLGSNSVDCHVHSESRCPGGFPPVDDTLIVPTDNSVVIGGNGDDDLDSVTIIVGDLVETTIDFPFHVYCATFKDPAEWSDYGCYCVGAKSLADVSMFPRVAVDKTDKCCQRHEKCYSESPAGCSCSSVKMTAYSATCPNWRRAKGFCEDVFWTNNRDECKRYCCECDFNAASCLADHLPSKKNDLWSMWLDKDRGECTQRCGTVPGCPCEKLCSSHGVIDGIGRDAFCLCFPGWKGKCCDQPDCECTNTQGHDCFSNGICLTSFGDERPQCSCLRGWRGTCCDRRIPVRTFGDPHLSTADGLDFDFFGIGEFWDCRSVSNDFGVQIRFFKHGGTSFTGAVAVKTDNATTTIYTLNDTSGADNLPRVRINGTILKTTWSDYPLTHSIDFDLVKLYVQPIRANGSLVRYLFQFTSGATYSVDVRYSVKMGRQYMDTEFGPVASFLHQTEGICGFMDNNVDNDLISSNGQYAANTTDFVESWRVGHGVKNGGDGQWSWSLSNFHPDDPLDSSYSDPYHRPVYGTEQLDANTRMIAEKACSSLQLERTLHDNCVLDFGLTGDETVIQQQAFQKGKCLNDCSNRGQCNNGTCFCIDSWTGEDCSSGGCSDCPLHSQCVSGFCQCEFGFFGPNCTEATCESVGNCTDSTHGLCREPDVCECSPGYEGADCGTVAVCSHNCSNHGTCLGKEECLCDFGWGGSQCAKQICENEAFCNGHGQCEENGTCNCNPGWRGSACDLFSCDGVDWCSGNGECVDVNTCQCYVGYYGQSCSNMITCPTLRNCSRNGVCVDDSTCLCYGGYFGDACDQFECTEGCSGRGTCEGPDICSCILGWTAFDCSVPSCEQLHFCSEHGRCIGPKTCDCDDNWTEPWCNVFTCTSNNRTGNCSHHGSCSAPGQCTCESDYCGDDCQYPVIDECIGMTGSDNLTNRCDQVCTDTCESYRCSCESGYILQEDGRSCQDIDECNRTAFSFRLNHCEHECVNTAGSFYCRCTQGYSLATNGGFCNDVDECSNTTSNSCDQVCMNTLGSYNCSCVDGYQLKFDGFSCLDIDECSAGVSECEHLCMNTEGSYNCSCQEGFLLDGDQRSCRDLPTASPEWISRGAVHVTVGEMTREQFLNSSSEFSRAITEAVWRYCRSDETSRCFDITTSRGSSLAGGRFYMQLTDVTLRENETHVIEATLYVFALSSLHVNSIHSLQMFIILASDVKDALTKADHLSFTILAVSVAYHPTVGPTARVDTQRGTVLSTGALIGIAGGAAVAIIVLLVIIACIVARQKKNVRSFEDSSTTKRTSNEMVLVNPTYQLSNPPVGPEEPRYQLQIPDMEDVVYEVPSA